MLSGCAFERFLVWPGFLVFLVFLGVVVWCNRLVFLGCLCWLGGCTSAIGGATVAATADLNGLGLLGCYRFG